MCARWLSDPRLPRLLPWLCGLVAAGLAAKNLVGGYADLGIYLDVGREFRQGGIDLCRPRSDSGPWVYPPWVALPFAGLQWALPDAAIRWLWSALLGLGTALLLVDLRTLLRPFGGLRAWQWAVFGLLFQRIFAQNMTHGQLSLWVGTAVARGLVHLQVGRDCRAGVWLGLAAAAKLTPLLFVVALPAMRRPRAAAVLVATVAGLWLLLPWPFCGAAAHWQHLCDFAAAIGGSLTGQGNAAIVQHHAGPSISGTLDYLLQPRPLDAAGRTANVLVLSDGTLRAVKLGWSALLGGLLLHWACRWRHAAAPQRWIVQAAAVTLAFSLFAPLTRVYHLAAALLPCALFCRGPAGRRDLLWWATALALLLSMTLRQKKLLGETLWRAFDHGGLLHFALVGLLVWLWRCPPPDPAPAPPA
jgi:hypothetical protein